MPTRTKVLAGPNAVSENLSKASLSSPSPDSVSGGGGGGEEEGAGERDECRGT